MVNFYSSIGLSSQIFRRSKDFREFLRKRLVCSPHIELLASLLMLVLLLSSTISGIPAVAGLSSTIVDVCDVSIVSAAVASALVASSCCCCWCPC
jgi:hypothetical protein